jgi:hypothetical protein
MQLSAVSLASLFKQLKVGKKVGFVFSGGMEARPWALFSGLD